MKLKIHLNQNQTEEHKDLIEEITDKISGKAMSVVFNYKLKFRNIEKIAKRVNIIRKLAEIGAIKAIDATESQTCFYWLDSIREDLEEICKIQNGRSK